MVDILLQYVRATADPPPPFYFTRRKERVRGSSRATICEGARASGRVRLFFCVPFPPHAFQLEPLIHVLKSFHLVMYTCARFMCVFIYVCADSDMFV